MPIYTYRCENCGVQFDRHQKFEDQPLRRCPECNKKALRKVIGPVGIAFKGSGFYATDNRSASSRAARGASEKTGKSEKSTGSATESSTGSSTESGTGASTATNTGGVEAAAAGAKTAAAESNASKKSE